MIQEIQAVLIFGAPVNRSLFESPAMFVSLAFIFVVILIDNIAMETSTHVTFSLKNKY